MSSGEVRKVSCQDIQLVQNLIEACLQQYMNQKEVVETLLEEAKIEPRFTELVWQKLEHENQEFFKAYHVCLMVKHQIMIFNNLLERQAELTSTIPSRVASVHISNGCHSTIHQAPFYVAERTVPLLGPEPIDLPYTTFLNGLPSMHGNMQSINDTAVHAGSMEISPTMHSTQNSHTRMINGMGGLLIKPEPGFADNSAFTFGADGNVLGIPLPLADSAVPSFCSLETISQPLNLPIPYTNSQVLNVPVPYTTTPYGSLRQMPRSFSFSDLAADFSQSSEILESLSRSPFVGTDVSDFLHSPEDNVKEEIGGWTQFQNS